MKIFICLLLCTTCALVSSQVSGTIPGLMDNKKSLDDNKFVPITNSGSKFSIGLGVLNPSYSQKFGDNGKTKLDFNQERGGYSYSLNNLVHPLVKTTDRSGLDDNKKYSTDTLKTADPTTHQLTTGQFSAPSYSLSVSSGSRSDSGSTGSLNFPQTQVNSIYGQQGPQVGPPTLPNSYGQQYSQNYGYNYGPQSYNSMASYAPPAYQGYPPMPYQNYPNNGPQYSQSGAYNPSPIASSATNMASNTPSSQYAAPTPAASAPVQQPYQPPVPSSQPQYAPNPYAAPMPSPYGYGAPPAMNSYNMYSQPPTQSYGYGNQYGYGGGGGGGYGLYGSQSQTAPSSYPYSGGSNDPLANITPQDLNTLRQLYGSSSSMSMSYMSPYSGMGGGLGSGGLGSGGLGSGSSYGGYGGSGGYGSSSGGTLSNLISLFG